ncbi:putative vacuole morphology and inheritance protein [Helianthus annuus]|nr:putative vacuole morphology and inheritance protein [Helianthus annuus]
MFVYFYVSIEEFIPLLRESMNVLNPYVRQFLVGWITVLDSVPDIDMLGFLPDFLDVLLLKSVDYGRMAEILVQRASSPDEFTRWTAITWVTIFFFNWVICIVSSP